MAIPSLRLAEVSLDSASSTPTSASNSPRPARSTNLQVGDGVPPGLEFFPAGDFFRYFEQLADPPASGDGLVDYSRFSDDSYAVPFASLTLDDPTGRAFTSLDLPRAGLPLSSFTDRFGEFSFYV